VSDLRIGRVLSRLGLCSRRDTAAFLETHSVVFNNSPITELNALIPEEALRKKPLLVDGRDYFLRNDPVLLLHKPVGFVCSHKAQKGQKTIFTLLPPEYENFYFAGRLDADSEGLVVLSSDGDLIYALTHPSQQTIKKYRVTLQRPIPPTAEQRSLSGIIDRGEKLKFHKLQKISPIQYEVYLTEGKKREIRRVFARIGSEVTRLIRVEMGPYSLGSIPEGQYVTVTPEDPGSRETKSPQ